MAYRSRPAGNVNPPRAIGWVIVIAGLGTLLGWASSGVEALGFLSFIVFGVTTLIFTLWLGASNEQGGASVTPDSI